MQLYVNTTPRWGRCIIDKTKWSIDKNKATNVKNEMLSSCEQCTDIHKTIDIRVPRNYNNRNV